MNWTLLVIAGLFEVGWVGAVSTVMLGMVRFGESAAWRE